MHRSFAVEHPISVDGQPCDATPRVDGDDVVARLQPAKERVRVYMDTVGEAAWRRVVHQPDPPWPVPRARPSSRADYKMYEIGKVCVLPPARTSLHLCEAPGGFVDACVDLYGPDLKWRAASLGAARGAPRFAPHLAGAGRVSEGDLLDARVRDELVATAPSRGVDLVTADGAAPMDHARLEESAAPLAEAQADVALRVGAQGGTFVLKVFEACEPRTLRWWRACASTTPTCRCSSRRTAAPPTRSGTWCAPTGARGPRPRRRRRRTSTRLRAGARRGGGGVGRAGRRAARRPARALRRPPPRLPPRSPPRCAARRRALTSTFREGGRPPRGPPRRAAAPARRRQTARRCA